MVTAASLQNEGPGSFSCSDLGRAVSPKAYTRCGGSRTRDDMDIAVTQELWKWAKGVMRFRSHYSKTHRSSDTRWMVQWQGEGLASRVVCNWSRSVLWKGGFWERYWRKRGFQSGKRLERGLWYRTAWAELEVVVELWKDSFPMLNVDDSSPI